MTTVDEIVTAVYKLMINDATLLSASHLNGTNSVVPYSTKPAGKLNPCLTMRFIPATVVGEQSFADSGLLWLNLYLDNFADLTPDKARSSRVEFRIYELLHEKIVNNGDVFVKCLRKTPGRMLPIDPQSPNETVWQFEYEIESART